MWYRVVTNKDGGIASCDQVEGQEHDGKGIFYVDAQTSAAACLAAKQMWLDRYEKAKKSNKTLRDDCKSRGICTTCKTKKARPAGVLCQACIDTKTERSILTRLGLHTVQKRGAITDESKQAVARQRNEDARWRWQRRQATREYVILIQVLAAFRSMTGPQFEGHLIAQIAELEAKRQQPKEPPKPEPKTPAGRIVKANLERQQRNQKAQAAE